MASASIHQLSSDEPSATAAAGDRDLQCNPALTPIQTQLIALLAAGSSVSAAARAAGIHRTTIHHWQRTSKEFNTALEQARREYTESLADEMHDLAYDALRTLRELLSNPDTPAAVRLRTALAILQRPQFPNPGWHLPARVEPEHERQFLDRIAAVEADYKTLRMSRSFNSGHHNSSESGMIGAVAPTQPPTPPRNSSCPCGSGKKYKRCCGHDAPPVLSALPTAA